MQNAGLDESQAGIKIARGNINNLRYADVTVLMAESKEELKSLLMNVKEESASSVQFSLVSQSCLTLRPHGLRHSRPLYPSTTPGVYSHSCPLSQ